MEELPTELILMIASHLSLRELSHFRQCNHNLMYKLEFDNFFFSCQLFYRKDSHKMFWHLACACAQIVHAQRLFQLYPKLFNVTDLFLETSSNGKNGLQIAKWLKKIHPEVILNIREKNDIIFYEAILRDDLEMIQWLIKIHPKFIDAMYYYFEESCALGRLALAKYFIENYSSQIKLGERGDELFGNVCVHGKKEIAQWLLEISPDINICANRDYAFIWACMAHHFELTEWLRSICPRVNVRNRNDFLFACAYNRADILVKEYLRKIEPNYESIMYLVAVPTTIDLIN